MSAPEITCFDCEGFGKIEFAFHPGSLPCRRCGGTGKCPAIMAKWRDAGKKLMLARISAGQGLHMRARYIGMDARLLSDIERGMRDPEGQKA